MIAKTLFVIIADEYFPYLTDEQIDTLYLSFISKEGNKEYNNNNDMVHAISKHIITETVVKSVI